MKAIKKLGISLYVFSTVYLVYLTLIFSRPLITDLSYIYFGLLTYFLVMIYGLIKNHGYADKMNKITGVLAFLSLGLGIFNKHFDPSHWTSFLAFLLIEIGKNESSKKTKTRR